MITIMIDSRLKDINILQDVDTNDIGTALKKVFRDRGIKNKMIHNVRVVESYRPKFYQTFDAKYDSDTNQLLYRRSGYNYPFDVK